MPFSHCENQQSHVVTKITYTPEDTESTIPKHVLHELQGSKCQKQIREKEAQIGTLRLSIYCLDARTSRALCIYALHTRCVFKRLPIASQRWGDLGHFGGELLEIRGEFPDALFLDRLWED